MLIRMQSYHCTLPTPVKDDDVPGHHQGYKAHGLPRVKCYKISSSPVSGLEHSISDELFATKCGADRPEEPYWS